MANVHTLLSRIISDADLKSLPFWGKLKPEIQEYIKSELVSVRVSENSLAKGRHLANIKQVLTAIELGLYTLLNKRELTGSSARAGYRLIQEYEDVVRVVKSPVLDELIKLNIKLLKSNKPEPLGDYQQAYVALVGAGIFPPDDRREAREYVKHLEIEHEKLKYAIVRPARPGKLKPESTASITEKSMKDLRRNLLLIPVEDREAFLEAVVGTALTTGKFPEKTFKPQPVPSELTRNARLVAVDKKRVRS